MPLGGNVRYRRKGHLRLAYRGDKLVEVKNMQTGAVHTEEEFKEDRKKELRDRRNKRRRKKK